MPPESIPVDFSKHLDQSALKGRTALVTGGASGIGAGIVRVLADAGASVTIADLNAEAGQKYCSELQSEGHSAKFIPIDVADWHSQLAAFKETIGSSPNGNIDIVIACAGIAGASCLSDAPFNSDDTSKDPEPPSFQIKMVNVNLVGSIYTSTLAAHYWRKRGEVAGDDNLLVLISSNIAYFPTEGYTGYTASKMGVRGLWKSLRDLSAFAPLFRTNLLAPHIVRSPMTLGLQAMLDENGMKMVEVDDCVQCLMRFCCDRSIRSRAVQVNPAGSWFDLHDDLKDFDGSKVFSEHHENETKPVFDFLAPDMSMS